MDATCSRRRHRRIFADLAYPQAARGALLLWAVHGTACDRRCYRPAARNAVELVVNAQVLNGFITPVLLTYILILANRRSVLGDAANGPRFRVLATVCVAIVGALSAVVLIQTVAGWL